MDRRFRGFLRSFNQAHAGNGAVSVAKVELGKEQGAELEEARVLQQRQASDEIDRLLAGVG